MDVGVCIAAKIDDVGIVPFAENLGYSHAWVADSQMIWSDCYAYLALAAERTRTINIGTGVSVVGTRTAPVTAHSIATINRLAPGRTFLGLGSGHHVKKIRRYLKRIKEKSIKFFQLCKQINSIEIWNCRLNH